MSKIHQRQAGRARLRSMTGEVRHPHTIKKKERGQMVAFVMHTARKAVSTFADGSMEEVSL